LVEWDEDEHPRNVVQTKNVSSVEGQGPGVKIGEMCSVRVREGAKMVPYSAKLLCSGKCLIYLRPQTLGDEAKGSLPNYF
jgi:hypothetical protein